MRWLGKLSTFNFLYDTCNLARFHKNMNDVDHKHPYQYGSKPGFTRLMSSMNIQIEDIETKFGKGTHCNVYQVCTKSE